MESFAIEQYFMNVFLHTRIRFAPFLWPALRTILFILLGFLLTTLPSTHGLTLLEVSKWWVLLCIVVNIITIISLFLLVKHDGGTFHDLIRQDPSHKRDIKTNSLIVVGMLVLGIGGLAGFSFLIYGYIPLTNAQPLPIVAAVISILLMPISTVFAEMPFYLGYCAPKIRRTTSNDFLSIAYPLFFFALQHSFMPLIFDSRHILSRFLQFIPLLILIGIWYGRKRDLLPLMIGHGILDFMLGIQILIVSIEPSIGN